VSEPLRALVTRAYAPRGVVRTLESTIDESTFGPRERAACRARLRLPAARRLIGTAGTLDHTRGTRTLVEAYLRLRAEHADLGLALAGDPRRTVPLPPAADILHLGALPHAAVADFYNALDVAVICMRDTAFGRYAFPQKAYEIIACGTPLVAARVGAMQDLLAPWPERLYTPDDADSLADCLRAQLARPRPLDIAPPTWATQAALLETLLLGATAAR
jgi:glycosyltransferase involved in cell wall biosynthesis